MRTDLLVGDVSAAESTALSLLFARFVSGQIPDAAWTQMMSILDDAAPNEEERSALVNFLSDACSDLGARSVEVPAPSEMRDYVTLMRAA